MNEPKKLDNNSLFAKTLIDYPPKYNLGDKVNYCLGKSSGVGYVSGRVFKEREKEWKYTINPVALKDIHFDATNVSDL
jgi:hypothetical protein